MFDHLLYTLIKLSALRSIVVFGLLLTAIGIAAETIGNYAGPIEYKGYLVFDYPEGTDSINNVVFTVDSSISPSLIIVEVPSPWTYSYSNGVLSLSGGSLSPGGTVQVAVSLNKYHPDGEYDISSIGTTTGGESSSAQGVLLVGDLILLRFLKTLSDNWVPLAGVVAVLGAIEVYLSQHSKKAIAVKPKTCKELIKECEKAKAEAMAAEAEADEARNEADEANNEQEQAQKDLDKARKKLDKINKDQTDDSEAYIEMDGRRITSMDLKLRSDASKKLWEQYKNGDIDAETLEEAWEELGEHSALDELREYNKEDAEKNVKEAQEKLQETEKNAMELNQKAAEAEQKAADAKSHMEKVCKLAEDCVKAEEEAKKPVPPVGGVSRGQDPATVEKEEPKEPECKEGEREIRPAGRPDSLWVVVDFSVVIKSLAEHDVAAAREMQVRLSNVADQLDLAGNLLGGLSAGKSMIGGIGAMRSGKYVSGAGGLVSGAAQGVLAVADPTVGVKGMEISIPTSGPEVITEILEATAQLGALVAGKVAKWLVHNDVYGVKLDTYRQRLTATPYEIWECRGGRWTCLQKIYEIEIGRVVKREGKINERDEYKMESDRNRYLFMRAVRRTTNRGKNQVESSIRNRAKFEQDHQPGPCGK